MLLRYHRSAAGLDKLGRLLPAVAASALLLAGCGSRQETVLGTAPDMTRLSNVSSLNAATSTKPVTLQGRMIEKCPVAGCWFRLQDQSGIIKVDTKEAGFVVTDVPLNTRITVSGTARQETGGQSQVAATGIRY